MAAQHPKFPVKVSGIFGTAGFAGLLLNQAAVLSHLRNPVPPVAERESPVLVWCP